MACILSASLEDTPPETIDEAMELLSKLGISLNDEVILYGRDEDGSIVIVTRSLVTTVTWMCTERGGDGNCKKAKITVCIQPLASCTC